MISVTGMFRLVLMVFCQVSLLSIANASPAPSEKHMPDYVKPCTGDPGDTKKVEACIRENIEALKPKLKEGIPEMNVPKLEPLFIKELVASDHHVLKISTEDLYVYGASDFQLGHILVDPANHLFKFDVAFPHLRLDGKYHVDGKIIMLVIKGHGNITGDIHDIKAAVSMHGNKVEKDGTASYHFSDMDIKIKVHKGKIHLTNLFDGDKQLGEVINTAINQNFEAFMKELSPIIEKALNKFLLGTAEGVAQSFPFESLFP